MCEDAALSLKHFLIYDSFVNDGGRPQSVNGDMAGEANAEAVARCHIFVFLSHLAFASRVSETDVAMFRRAVLVARTAGVCAIGRHELL